MYLIWKVSGAFLALAGAGLASGCGSAAKEIGGNWYCGAVNQLQYTNVGTPGTYNKVTHMGADGVCASEPTEFSGPLAPLDGEVSLHFRGPLALKQFASYSMTTKKREVSKTHVRRHGHSHEKYHARHAKAKSEAENEKKKRGEDWVVATIDGQVVSWINNYFGPGGSAPTPAPAAPAPVAPAAANIVPAPAAPAGAAPAKSTKSPSAPGTVNLNAAYTRSGYYDSKSQTLDGLTFLGNYGGAGSGVFDNNYGNSLSYINSAGTGCASSAQVLADTTVGSNQEFTIMTDSICSGDSCGYVRPGAVAYHGFDGADKIFLFEFQMPTDGTTGFNADAPAIWMLNAQIPRTLQYGKPECSCWTTGCGEFDIVEVLSAGSMFCKSTLHTNTPGGDSNYITRPTKATMKLAVIFQSATSDIIVQVLPDETEFGTSLTAAQVEAFVDNTPSDLRSLFEIVS